MRTERITIIDIIRVIAIAAVILIHTSSRTLEQANYDILRLPFSFYLNVIARFAVPMFFLISGVVLGHRYLTINTKEFYKKRALRIFVPYFVWSIFFYFIINANPWQIFFTLGFVKTLLVEGSAFFHLYFILPLLLLYLVFPFIVKNMWLFSSRILHIVLIAITITLLMGEYRVEYLSVLPDSIRLFILNFYIFLFGILVGRNQEKVIAFFQKKYIIISLAIFIAFLCAAAIEESKSLYLRFNNVRFIGAQWRLVVYVYTVLLFSVFLYTLPRLPKRAQTFLASLSGLTFFVYFIHVLYINVFWRFIGSYLFYSSGGKVVEYMWFDLLSFSFVTIASFGTAYLLTYLPKGKWIIGL